MFLPYCAARMEREIKEAQSRAYLAETLRLTSKNTAVLAGILSNGKAGEYTETKWADLFVEANKPKETRTEQEIISSIAERARA